jgi:Type IV secretion system pilin
MLHAWIANLPSSWGINANSIGIPNSTHTLGQGIANGIKLGITLIGMLAVIFMIYGGLQMVVSAGSPTRFAKARETLIYASVGLVVAIGALAIVTAVTNYIH